MPATEVDRIVKELAEELAPLTLGQLIEQVEAQYNTLGGDQPIPREHVKQVIKIQLLAELLARRFLLNPAALRELRVTVARYIYALGRHQGRAEAIEAMLGGEHDSTSGKKGQADRTKESA